ncbi:SdpI family protein [Curtobacterium sp. L3-7]|uniref:SdpI family protein n=1 Tax=Curtobacterium sp. L3-7 TaxID=3138787 RepID=UPI003B526DBC
MSGAMVFALMAEIGAAVLVAWVTWRAAVGSLGRNGFAGVRTGITMSSDRAWRTGHRAALRPTLISGMITVAWCVLSILITPLRTPSSVIVASVLLVGGALLSIPAAHRAVRRASGDAVDTPQPPRRDV